MLPANQGFDAGELHRARRELRLIPGDKLAVLDAGKDLVGQALVVDDVGLETVIEELVAVPALALGAVKGDVGIDQHLACIDVHAIGERDADGDAAAAGKALEVDRLAHLLDDPACKGRHIRIAGVVRQDHELIAADARHEVVLA